MEIPRIPELNESTLEEKADSARQKKDLSLPNVWPTLRFRDLALILFMVLLAGGIVVLLIDYVFKGNRGAEGPAPPSPSRLVSNDFQFKESA